jgi:DNA-binding response OmpR family regulator
MNNLSTNRILVVDDEPDIALSLKIGLENNGGFIVDIFDDPIEALSNFKAGKYDLLLLDIKMPKMDGFELYKEIKKKDDKVKICFLTASESYYDEFKGTFPKLNIRCFARKPVSIQELIKVVKEELLDKQ